MKPRGAFSLSEEELKIAPWFIRRSSRIFKIVVFVVGFLTVLWILWVWVAGGLVLGFLFGAVLIWTIASCALFLWIINTGFLIDAFQHNLLYISVFLMGPLPGLFFWDRYCMNNKKPRLSARPMRSEDKDEVKPAAELLGQ